MLYEILIQVKNSTAEMQEQFPAHLRPEQIGGCAARLSTLHILTPSKGSSLGGINSALRFVSWKHFYKFAAKSQK